MRKRKKVFHGTRFCRKRKSPVKPDLPTHPLFPPGTVIPKSRSGQKIALARLARTGLLTPHLFSSRFASVPGVQTRSKTAAFMSTKKMELTGPSTQMDCEDFTKDYHLIQLRNLTEAVGTFSCCRTPLSVTDDRSARRGFVSRLSINCTVCGKSAVLTNPYSAEDLKVNTRSVLAARAIGKGSAGLATLLG